MTCLTIRTALFAAAFTLLTPAPLPAQPKKLVMGCTQLMSSEFGYCTGQAKVISRALKDVAVTVMTTGATVDNIQRMQKGTIDYGLVTNDQTYLAWKGEGDWAPSPFPDIRNLWYYAISAVYVSVREDTGITSLAELQGKKFNPGIRGSATEKMIEASLTHLGITPEWVRGGIVDSVDAMKRKRIVGYAKAGKGLELDDSTIDVATETPIRVLPFAEEQMKKVQARYPLFHWVQVRGTPWGKVPAKAVKGMSEFWTPAVIVGFAAPKSMPNDLAYSLVKAVMESPDRRGVAFKSVAGEMIKLTMEQSRSPLHAGAVRYYREKGVKIPDALLPPESP